MWGVFSSDLLKIKRKLILFLIVLGPLGVISLEAVNFGLRYDYLSKIYASDLWSGLLNNVQQLSVVVMLLGIAIITSLMATIEHQTNAWKQVLALPISRTEVYTAKFLFNGLLLFASCILLAFGSVILGIALGFGTDVPYTDLLKITFFPFLAALPFLAVQIWLAVTFKNQSIALTFGIVYALFSSYTRNAPDWLPLKWPLMMNSFSVITGVVTGLIVLTITLVDFAKRDVN